MDFLDQTDLMRRLLAGDQSVLKDLGTDVWPGVCWRIEKRFAGRLHRDDMRDVLQETLWTLWQKRENYDASKGSLASWFAGIAFKTAQDIADRGWVKQRQCERAVDLLEIVASARVVEESVDDETKPAAPSRQMLALRECLALMTERRRQILFARRACDGEPPSSRALAEELGTTPEVVRQELHRAEAAIRGRFAQSALDAERGGGSPG
jgi:RNA polymerase sigma factor (sigma-70 family)